MSNLKSDFDRKGFTTIPYPEELRKSVLCLADTWKKWCSLDEKVKKKFPYANGVGYEFQDTPGETRDIKEIFHFTGEKGEWLLDQAQNAKSMDALDLITHSRNVLENLFPEILKYNEQLEKEFGIEGLRDEVEASKNKIFIRLIHYLKGRGVGNTLAADHVDKSGETEHLYEDSSGVEGLGKDGVWRPMPTWNDEMIAFGSMQLQLRSKNRIKALCHRVIATNESAQNGRVAIVAFTELIKTPTYNKAHRGRLQDMPAGFNYNMSFEEFQKFFA